MRQLTAILASERCLNFDKHLVRYSGHSLLHRAHAWQRGARAGPTLLLRSLGRVSGVWREAVLPYFPIGGEWVVAGSRGGKPADPQWALNLRASPEGEIFIGRQWRAVYARELAGEEYARAWSSVVQAAPVYGEHQRLCRQHRQIPLFALGQGQGGAGR